MRKKFLILIITIIWIAAKIEAKSITISDLKPIKKYVNTTNESKVLLYREFKINGATEFLAADSSSLKTFILKPEEITNEIPIINFEKTKLYRILQAKEPIKFITADKGYVLTVDLCAKPEKQKNKFEEEFFNFLIKLHSNIPVAVAISGVWILKEPENFAKIIKARREGKLDVIWINHSMTHPILHGKFLTAQSVNFENEVLGLEKLLLENEEVPSLFFRFPGLVYNTELLELLTEFSLIPVDSNAWLAKGEKPKNGSIILVHGNGNEGVGIKIFFNMFKREKVEFISIYDLKG